ncbi:sensor histidine kinase [Epilithonimonas arachidiradicis]|uniref:histidine kinase n=1 Tax=Epilithonimonas arachidiradicis TaxID=1617282 RepID=A0A420CPU5_9FLAO|nr:HAMP domain-containing sensor histidine kinase [Epilithonimonas arachidiradicis]RKE80417.1 histidine kinase/DNA gyrase B/HSP90-like ATPase [Epilithonimonas arachidiradicis]GGG63877.1 two-component sensor histidine kinase [Epilithonimonas arachidiradicis]
MKGLNFLKRINSWVVYIILTSIVAGIIISSNFLIQHLRGKETERIKSLATAMRYLQDSDVDPRFNELALYVISENEDLPIIVTNKKREVLESRGISEEILKDKEKLKAKMTEMESKYPPFEIQLPDFNNQYLYYDNSDLMNYLRYYPLLLAIFISLYLVFSFWFLRLLKKTDEGFVWAGLAKETAHQIGTPLSSMIGWVEIMKLEDENGMGVKELEMDVNRLKTISERFSKIGSIPTLNDLDINETVQQNFDYLKSRISTKVEFTLRKTYEPVLVPHSQILMSWVIENLVKNAVDAMKGEGKLELSLYKKNKNVYIDVTDTGCGMTKQQIRNAFKPGFSTKKRGWGLGLSLTKRVVSEYHKGDVRIANSEVGKGTTFRIILREEQKS